MLSCSTNKILLLKPFTRFSNRILSYNTIRLMSSEREQEIVNSLTTIREEVEKLRGNNTVKCKIETLKFDSNPNSFQCFY